MSAPARSSVRLFRALPKASSQTTRRCLATGSPSRSQSSSEAASSSKSKGDDADPFAAFKTTHFGFKDVPESDKESMVGGVFSSVASSYDVMNDAMSLGIHRVWKDHYVKKLNPHGPIRCLDVAGGTGDIAERILDHARLKHSDRSTKVHVLDINANMLKEGRKRFARTMYHGSPQISFEEGNAEKLDTIADSSIDMYTIAFGIRNCTHIDKVLSEAFRVLKPGGLFSCLEFSKVNNPVLAKLYQAYSFSIIPNLGHIIAGDRDSYQYLVESIERFPSQEDFADMIQAAGFTLPTKAQPWEDLTFGVAAIHTAAKVI